MQEKFLASSAQYRAFVGGIGSGKTYAGALAALLEANKHTLGLVIAPTYPMLRDASLRTFLQIAGRWVREFNKAEMSCVLGNGAEVLFRSADNPDRLRGPNASWFWFDEGAVVPDVEPWQVAIGRLREGGKVGRGWVTTTPKGYNWVYDEFGPTVVEASGGAKELFTTRTADNPFLAPEFVQGLQNQYSGAFRKQELEGAFVPLEGTAFRNIRACLGEWEQWPFEPYAGTFVMGVDWGQSKDYTVAVVMDARTRWVVDRLRVNKIDWAFQREQVIALYRKWKCDLAVVEANSIGGPNIEALTEENINVFPFWTDQIKKARVIQQLIMAFEQRTIRIPPIPNLLQELDAFQQEQLPSGRMRYEAPQGAHDDEVIALALAYDGCGALV